MLYYAINSTLQYKSLYISEALLNYENVLGYLFFWREKTLLQVSWLFRFLMFYWCVLQNQGGHWQKVLLELMHWFPVSGEHMGHGVLAGLEWCVLNRLKELCPGSVQSHHPPTTGTGQNHSWEPQRVVGWWWPGEAGVARPFLGALGSQAVGQGSQLMGYLARHRHGYNTAAS